MYQKNQKNAKITHPLHFGTVLAILDGVDDSVLSEGGVDGTGSSHSSTGEGGGAGVHGLRRATGLFLEKRFQSLKSSVCSIAAGRGG